MAFLGDDAEESSSIEKRCWIFSHDFEGKVAKEHMGELIAATPHLSVGQAKRLIRALEKFIKDEK